MKFRRVIVAAAVGALLVPSVALAKGGDRDHDRDRGRGHDDVPRWILPWDRDSVEQSWTLGEELLLTGYGTLRAHIVAPTPPPPPAGSPPVAATPLSVTIKARRGAVRVYGGSDLVVTCKGRGFKTERTDRDGKKHVKCVGLGSAVVTGTDFWVGARAKIMQVLLPKGATGEATTWGWFWAGPAMPDDPADTAL